VASPALGAALQAAACAVFGGLLLGQAGIAAAASAFLPLAAARLVRDTRRGWMLVRCYFALALWAPLTGHALF
jgi:hypothetical protein